MVEKFGKKRFGLTHHRCLQVAVIFRIEIMRRRVCADLTQSKPLPGEVLDKRRCFWVTEHPVDMRPSYTRLQQRAIRSRFKQGIIRHTRPQKIRDAARELIGIQGTGWLRIRNRFGQIQKIRAGQNCRQRNFNGICKVLLPRAALGKQREFLRHFRWRYRAPISPRHKPLKDTLCGDGFIGWRIPTRAKQLHLALWRPRRIHRPL